MSNYVLILLIWNIIVMLVYGIDKLRARRSTRRISERALIICAFLLGGMGAMLGMIVFNHKTSKIKFRILVPLSAIIVISATYYFRLFNGI